LLTIIDLPLAAVLYAKLRRAMREKIRENEKSSENNINKKSFLLNENLAI